MPFIVQDLIEDKSFPITAKPNEPVQIALTRMLEHDYSQLPVIDDNKKPLGMVTAESILWAQNHFGLSLDDLHVSAAMLKAHKFQRDADLFELLNKLRDTYAVLIVDRDRNLIGIITNYDTTEYFRRRAEDMMYVEDIEGMIKDYIQAVFTLPDGKIDEENLEQAIQEIISSDSVIQQKFRSAMFHYFNLHSEATKEKIVPNSDLVNKIIAEHLQASKRKKLFEELTMSEFITLFLHNSRWSRYEPIFKVKREAIFKLLDQVRETRNALAHFRGDISAVHRDRLRFCSEWLAQYYDEIINQDKDFIIDGDQSQISLIESEETDEELYLDEELDPNESRYAALALWLQKQPTEKDTVSLTFEQIQEIIGSELPDSAYKHRSWWANDPSTHVQAQQWLDADWRVYSINIGNKQVTFTRIAEREKLYIDFFSAVLDELRNIDKDGLVGDRPSGQNWLRIWLSFNTVRVGFFDLTFIRNQKIRLSFYVELGDKVKNKKVAERLANTDDITSASNFESVWERLDSNRPSRLAIYYDGAITDNDEKLTELRTQTVRNLAELRSLLQEPLTQIIDNLKGPDEE